MIQQWNDPWRQPAPLPLPNQTLADENQPPRTEGEPIAPACLAAQQPLPGAPLQSADDPYQWMLLL